MKMINKETEWAVMLLFSRDKIGLDWRKTRKDIFKKLFNNISKMSVNKEYGFKMKNNLMLTGHCSTETVSCFDIYQIKFVFQAYQ